MSNNEGGYYMENKELLPVLHTVTTTAGQQTILLPLPTENEILKEDFDYPKFVRGVEYYISQLFPEIQQQVFEIWKTTTAEKPYDEAIRQLQLEYEESLLTQSPMEDITEQMKKVVTSYLIEQDGDNEVKREFIRQRLEELTATKPERIAAYREGKIQKKELYMVDLRGHVRIRELAEFKRFFLGELSPYFSEDISDEEICCMTVEQAALYNRDVVEKKHPNRNKAKAKRLSAKTRRTTQKR